MWDVKKELSGDSWGQFHWAAKKKQLPGGCGQVQLELLVMKNIKYGSTKNGGN